MSLSPFDIAVGAGIVAGVTTTLLFNIGPGAVNKGLAFLVGALPAAVVTDWAAKEDNVNVRLAESAYGLLTDWPWGTMSFGMVFVGTTLVLNIAYVVLVMPEIEVFLDLLPILNMDRITVAIVVLSGAATLLFAGVAGWTIEVIQFIISPTSAPFNGNPPTKPGGRHVWGLSKLSKDLVYFVLALPIGFIQTVEYAVKKRSFYPVLFAPVKMAVDQFSRLGDVMLDLYVPEEAVIGSISKAAKEFEKIVFWLANHADSDQLELTDGVKKYGKPAAPNLGGNESPDPTWARWEKWYSEDPYGQAQILYPFLYSEGDNTPSSS